MYDHVLVPVAMDHPERADEAMRAAGALLSDAGEITVLNVVEFLPAYVEPYLVSDVMVQNEDAAKKMVEGIAGGHPRAHGATVQGHAGQSILHWAEGHDVDCIVIASHKPGLSDFLIGSTAARVVRQAQCAVHVVR